MAVIPQISYGIPAMDYGALTKSLSDLGQQVGQAFAAKEYQKQAQAVLPVFQEAMKSFESGDSSGGYSAIVSLAAQNQSNPYVQNLANLAMMGGQAIDENRYKTMRLAASGATLPAGPSGSDRLRAGQGGGGVPAVGNMNAEFVDEADAIDAQAMAEMPEFESPEQEQMYEQVVQFRAKPPEEQQATLTEATASQVPKGYESRKIDGLSNLFPNLKGDLLIPNVGTTTKIKRTVSTSDKPGSEIRESLSEVDEKVGEERYGFNIKAVNNLPDAVNAMNKQAPIGEREPFVKLFNRNGGIANAVTAPTDDPEIYSLTFQGNDKDEYSISKDQASKLTVAQSIPALSGSGIKFLASEKPAAEAPAEAPAQPQKERFPVKGEAATQQPTSGLPAAQLPSAPDNPFTKLVQESSARQSKSQKTSNEKSLRTRISDYDKKISSLSGGSTRKDLMRPEFLQKQKAEYDRLWSEREALKSELEKLTSSK
jgi:hypothetical protein